MDAISQAIANYNSHLMAGDGCFKCRAAINSDAAFIKHCDEGVTLLVELEGALRIARAAREN